MRQQRERQANEQVNQPTNGDTSATIFIKLRFNHSDDLVDELEGIVLYQVYKVKCNDDKVRPVKVALLDRGKQRVGIVLISSDHKANKVGGNMGGRAYTSNSTAFVSLDWFLERLEE